MRHYLSRPAVQAALFFLCVAAQPAGATVAPRYALALYAPGGDNVLVSGMAETGHLTGIFWKPRPGWDWGARSSFLSTGAQFADLGLLDEDFYAADINRHDTVVGTSNGPAGLPNAYLIQSGQLRSLGTLGGLVSAASAINDLGQVSGASGTASSGAAEHAFLWEHGVMRDLGTLGGPGGTSNAVDLNNHGQIAGNWTFSPGGTSRAFLHQDGVMRDLGTLGGDSAGVHAISQAGHVLGLSTDADGVQHNFIFYQGVMARLTAQRDSYRAYDINSAGDAVGGSFIWSDGVRHDLNRLVPAGWSIGGAAAINDRGQIAAIACLAAQCSPAVLTPVPEPAAAFLLLAGLPLLGWAGQRRRAFGRVP